LLDQYAALVAQVDAILDQVQAQLGSRLELIRLGVIALLIAIGLSQLAPIYLGWELLSGRRDPAPYPPPALIATDGALLTDRATPVDLSYTAALHQDSEDLSTANPGEDQHAQT
jgi:hypothetical protein